eukprot:COSAG06_NODE_45146_length_357_cov_0.794574_1_plen_54_part_01
MLTCFAGPERNTPVAHCRMPTAKVGTQWFAVDADDKPTGEPTDIELAYETYGDA